jgi:hypothetical protein
MSSPYRMLFAFTITSWITLAPGGIAHARHSMNDHHGRLCGSAPEDGDQMAAVRAQATAECDCAGARNHGAYVSCVAHAVKQAARNGALAKQCRRAAVSCAVHSSCGKPGFVTCCRTNSDGVPTCSVTKANDCRASEGGTATVGEGSCCDGCGGGTTTTTLPSACGNGHLDPGEQCDPPGSRTCPPGSPAGAILDCLPGCVCPGGTTTTTRPTATTTTIPSGSTTTTVPSGSTTTTAPSGSTTTTTPTGSTTTTTGGGGATRLSFTTAVGTASCGSGGLSTPPASPVSGELDSDTGCTAKIVDLGLGCLYFGGGSATVVAGGKIPDAATSLLDISGPGTLAGSPGTSSRDCTLGAGPGRHCVNNNSLPSCTADSGCGGAAGSCALDANCFFGPPLPILSPAPFASLTTCVMNVVQTDAGGTFDATTGDSSVSLPLSSRVYITGNTASPCPKCVSGACDPTWKTNTNTTSPDTGKSCTPVGAQLTTTECRPSLPGFQAPLPVDLTPLTSGTATMTAANGLFCPNQVDAGAFGQAGTQCVAETGAPAGNLGDGQPHPAVLGSVFCIPATGNAAVDGVADLPGPGAIGLNGIAQLQ